MASRRNAMSDFIITEFEEQRVKTAQEFIFESGSPLDPVKDHEHLDTPELLITFEEDHKEEEHDIMILPLDGVIEFSEELDLEGVDGLENIELDELMDGMKFELPAEDHENNDEEPSMKFRLPGAADYSDDDGDDEPEEEELEEIITDWMNDRDPSKFMEYINSAYPGGIPAHDGKSTLGCEKAVLYLVKLNKEISEALRSDKNDALDLPTLEKARVNMVRDMVVLKEHVKKINKRHKKADLNDSNIVKTAGTPVIQLVVTPWERAIAGMIINAVVSAGKPFDEVYEFLRDKYDFTERDELSIQQLLKDMGQPIYKDRGTIGDTDSDEDNSVDYVKSYFA